ncbi:hypothetical protein LXL04_029798 [Taraxacum kok-saghyz]
MRISCALVSLPHWKQVFIVQFMFHCNFTLVFRFVHMLEFHCNFTVSVQFLIVSWADAKIKVEKNPQGCVANPYLDQLDVEKLFHKHVKSLHDISLTKRMQGFDTTSSNYGNAYARTLDNIDPNHGSDPWTPPGVATLWTPMLGALSPNPSWDIKDKVDDGVTAPSVVVSFIILFLSTSTSCSMFLFWPPLSLFFNDATSSGKLRIALLPRIANAALSYASAASIAVSNVPNQTLDPRRFGSRISAANFPHGLCLTPLYLLSSLPPANCSAGFVDTGSVTSCFVTSISEKLIAPFRW